MEISNDKLQIFREAYKNGKLEIISDFNRTLTKSGFSTSFSSVSKGGYLDKDYVKQRDEMFKENFPYETGENGAPIDVRKSVVNKWFADHMKLFVQKKLPFSVLEKIVFEGENFNEVRENFTDFFDLVIKSSIPLTIISGGLGDMIDLTLRKYQVSKTSLVNVLSNYFIWQNRIAVGYNIDFVMDTINKDRDYSQLKIDDETCLIVLGDTPDDLEVLSKLKYKDVISIGYKVKEKGTISEREFDYLLEKDESLLPIIDLLKQIIN